MADHVNVWQKPLQLKKKLKKKDGSESLSLTLSCDFSSSASWEEPHYHCSNIIALSSPLFSWGVIYPLVFQGEKETCPLRIPLTMFVSVQSILLIEEAKFHALVLSLDNSCSSICF